MKTGGRGHVKKRRVARSSRKKRGRGARRVVPLCMALLVAAALVAAGLFCWQKWLRFDDAADIQGSWQVQADGESIVFDARDMKITKGISYEYRLDTGAKTISYQFGNLAGAGHYYFSADRRTLVILENGYQAGLLAEAGFLSEDLLGRAGEDGVIVLVKLSDDTDADPSGTATGITGATTGEREYVGQQASASSSSQAKSSSSSGASSNASHAASTDADGGVDGGSGRGFVDADGDGYDDASGMDYEGFMAQRDASDADSTDGGENGATDGGS